MLHHWDGIGQVMDDLLISSRQDNYGLTESENLVSHNVFFFGQPQPDFHVFFVTFPLRYYKTILLCNMTWDDVCYEYSVLYQQADNFMLLNVKNWEWI